VIVSGTENRFEWDEHKDAINCRKHGISFETATLVFDDPQCLVFVERIEGGEERWHAIGAAMGLLLLTVVHAYRQRGSIDIIRIISARRATPHERKLYVENL
jgi:uncharacterized DUF497 family protein